jgi:hypothetical protein
LSIIQYSKEFENTNFLEYWMMDKVQKLTNSECYTPLSEPTRIYINIYVCVRATCPFHARRLKSVRKPRWSKWQQIARIVQSRISTWRVDALYEIWLLLCPRGGEFVGCCLSSSLLWPLNSGPETEQQIRTSYAGKPSNPPAAGPRHLSLVFLPFLIRSCFRSAFVINIVRIESRSATKIRIISTIW